MYLLLCRVSRSISRFTPTMILLALAGPMQMAAQAPRGPRVLPPGPMIDGGKVTLTAPSLSVELLKYSGTVAKLTTTADPTLDYTPGDRVKERSADTFYHLGDLDLRFRADSKGEWKDVSTAFHRAPVMVTTSDDVHFISDVTSSLPQGTPLKVI